MSMLRGYSGGTEERRGQPTDQCQKAAVSGTTQIGKRQYHASSECPDKTSHESTARDH